MGLLLAVGVVVGLTLVRAPHGSGDLFVAGKNHGPVRGLAWTPCRCRCCQVAVVAAAGADRSGGGGGGEEAASIFVVVVVVVVVGRAGLVIGDGVSGGGHGAGLRVQAVAFDLGTVEIHAPAGVYLQPIDRRWVEVNQEQLILGRGPQAVGGRGAGAGDSGHVQQEADGQPQAPPLTSSRQPGPPARHAGGDGGHHLQDRVTRRTLRSTPVLSFSLSSPLSLSLSLSLSFQVSAVSE